MCLIHRCLSSLRMASPGCSHQSARASLLSSADPSLVTALWSPHQPQPERTSAGGGSPAGPKWPSSGVPFSFCELTAYASSYSHSTHCRVLTAKAVDAILIALHSQTIACTAPCAVHHVFYARPLVLPCLHATHSSYYLYPHGWPPFRCTTLAFLLLRLRCLPLSPPGPPPVLASLLGRCGAEDQPRAMVAAGLPGGWEAGGWRRGTKGGRRQAAICNRAWNAGHE